MDRPTITVLIFVVTATIIAYVGIQFGDELEATLPGGKATGIIAGVILLLSLLIGSYKTLKSIEYNKLNEEGFKNLLEIHFGLVSHELVHVFNDALLDLNSDLENLNTTLVVINSKRVIDQSRSKLTPFSTQHIPNLSKYLDEYFSPADLEKHIEEAVSLLKGVTEKNKQKKLIFQLIQRVQSDLLREIYSSVGKNNSVIEKNHAPI